MTIRFLFSVFLASTPAFLPPLVFGLELLVIGWDRSSLRRTLFKFNSSRFTDSVFYALELTKLKETVVGVSSLGLGYAAASFALMVSGSAELHRIRTGHRLADLFLYLLVYTFFDYWNHRLWHTGPFWYLHRLHHSATELSPIVSHRNHPLQLALEPFIRAWPLALFAIPGGYMLLFSQVDYFYQLLLHSNVMWGWGWFGRWVFVSPQAHRIHHSPLPEHFDKNLSILVIWDRLFGTWYNGTIVNETVGIHNAEVHNNGHLLRECVLDAKQFFQSLRIRPFAPETV